MKHRMKENMDANITLEDIKRWKVPALKQYLRNRKLKVTGNKSELCAIVYAAHLDNKPVAVSAAEESLIKAAEYHKLLVLGDTVIPDPFNDIQNGWLSEKDGVFDWPPTMQVDIATYLLTHVDDRNLSKRLLSDYKEGKAYSYFDSAWLKELFYHPISKESKFCVLKATCTPSERIYNIPHRIWVAAEKKTGTIRSAYCTCFAGQMMEETSIWLGSTCNHVAAVLFKVDHAWKMGWTNKSCTSRPCEWNEYGAKAKLVEPKQICDMKWRKQHYKKEGKRPVMNHAARQLFQPIKHDANNEKKRTGLLNALYCSTSSACAFQYISLEHQPSYLPCDDVNMDHEVEVSTDVTIPPTLSQMAAGMTDADSFIESLPSFDDAQQQALEIFTRGQGDNKQWKEQRIGRVSGSTCHNVMTKMRTLALPVTKRSTEIEPLVKTIMGQGQSIDHLASVKYGKDNEGKARKAYKDYLVKAGHKNVSVNECGLYVHKTEIYIAATPDGIVHCDCCGDGLVEIKCPHSIAHLHPKDANLKYIKKDGSKEIVNPNHAYYSQIILQMGVTERKWCDFFLFTQQGHHIIRVPFDEERWTELTTASKKFFCEYLVNYLVEGPVSDESPSVPSAESLKTTVSTSNQTTTYIITSSEPVASTSQSILSTYLAPVASGHRKRKRSKRVQQSYKPLYYCNICREMCKQEEDCDEGDNSVQCSTCMNWFHWSCVDYVDDDDDDDEEWYCLVCQMEVH